MFAQEDLGRLLLERMIIIDFDHFPPLPLEQDVLTVQEAGKVIIVELKIRPVILAIAHNFQPLEVKAAQEPARDNLDRLGWVGVNDLIGVREDRVELATRPVMDGKHKGEAPHLLAVENPADRIIRAP